MKKKHLKYNKNYRFQKILLTFGLIIVLSSAAYSVFTETLNINGSATSATFSAGQLDLVGPPYGSSALVASTYVNYIYPDSTHLTTNFSNTNTGGATKTETFTLNFRNGFTGNITGGYANVVINSGATVSGSAAAVTSATLIPNAQGSVTVDIAWKGKSFTTINALCTIQYTHNSVTQYFYWTIIVS